VNHPKRRFGAPGPGHPPAMRAMFTAYWILLAAGFAFYLYVGVANR
jgi:hypothetical protein